MGNLCRELKFVESPFYRFCRVFFVSMFESLQAMPLVSAQEACSTGPDIVADSVLGGMIWQRECSKFPDSAVQNKDCSSYDVMQACNSQRLFCPKNVDTVSNGPRGLVEWGGDGCNLV